MYAQAVETDACRIAYRNCLNHCIEQGASDECIASCDAALKACLKGGGTPKKNGTPGEWPVWAWVLVGLGALVLILIAVNR